MYNFRKRSDAAMTVNNEPSMTRQEFTAACDVNNILRKYMKNGVNPFVITQDARYGDFASLPGSYSEAIAFVNDAEDQFMQLPAALRARFSNDPGLLLDFLNDPQNAKEAVELGLMESVPNLDNSSNKKNSPPQADVKGGAVEPV